VYEVQPVERVILVLDTPVQMRAALGASMALNGRVLVHNGEFIRVRGDADFFPWDDRNNSECRTCRFPAFAAATGVVVQRLSIDGDLNLIGRAQALQCTAGEVRGSRG
jgi:hypothetical protein